MFLIYISNDYIELYHDSSKVILSNILLRVIVIPTPFADAFNVPFPLTLTNTLKDTFNGNIQKLIKMSIEIKVNKDHTKHQTFQ